jgi:hypothetical protein
MQIVEEPGKEFDGIRLMSEGESLGGAKSDFLKQFMW